MKHRFLLLLSVSLTSTLLSAADNLVRRLVHRYEGKVYEFMVMQSDLDAAPAWPDREEDPPLSPRSAVNAARDYVATAIPNSSRWTLSKISLESPGREPGQWLYVVEFTSFSNRHQVLLGPGHTFAIPILLNGRVVKPTVTAAKDPK